MHGWMVAWNIVCLLNVDDDDGHDELVFRRTQKHFALLSTHPTIVNSSQFDDNKKQPPQNPIPSLLAPLRILAIWFILVA